MALELSELTEKILGCAFKVSNALGAGFLEKVYENALVHELRKSGVSIEQQFSIRVIYDGVDVGEYAADIVVERSVIVEVKALKSLSEIHQAQLLNYLRATGMKVGLLINFGAPKVEFRRLVL